MQHLSIKFIVTDMRLTDEINQLKIKNQLQDNKIAQLIGMYWIK